MTSIKSRPHDTLGKNKWDKQVGSYLLAKSRIQAEQQDPRLKNYDNQKRKDIKACYDVLRQNNKLFRMVKKDGMLNREDIWEAFASLSFESSREGFGLLKRMLYKEGKEAIMVKQFECDIVEGGSIEYIEVLQYENKIVAMKCYVPYCKYDCVSVLSHITRNTVVYEEREFLEKHYRYYYDVIDKFEDKVKYLNNIGLDAVQIITDEVKKMA